MVMSRLTLYVCRAAEDDLAGRGVMELGSSLATLTIFPIRLSDEGHYKCETTYLGQEQPQY